MATMAVETMVVETMAEADTEETATETAATKEEDDRRAFDPSKTNATSEKTMDELKNGSKTRTAATHMGGMFATNTTAKPAFGLTNTMMRRQLRTTSREVATCTNDYHTKHDGVGGRAWK